MKQRRIEGLVFDFDGTLAHLTIDFALMKRKVAALAEAFMGERPDPPELPALEWIDELARDIEEFEGRDLALEFHSRGRLIVQATELDAARTGGLFPFTRELLAGLRRRGVRTGVITRNSTAAVKTVFPDIEACVDVFLAREDVAGVKPDPIHLREALARMGVEACAALMVGDHALDIETGNRAGVACAAVSTGNMDAAALREAGADMVAGSAEALVELLLEQERM